MVKMIARVVVVVGSLFGISTCVLGDPLLTFTTNMGVASGVDFHLFVLDVGAGGDPLDITPPDADGSSPVWSPDGTRILFASREDGDPGLNYDLYTISWDGGDLQRITNSLDRIESDAVWSPDGQKIAYLVGNPNKSRSVWTLDLNSRVERELVPLGGEVLIGYTRLAWSSDGQQIAFNAIAGGTLNLYAVHTDTKRLGLLNKGLFVMQVQDWLSTGEILVKESGGGKLCLLSLNGEFEILFPEIQEKLVVLSAKATQRRPDLFVLSAYPVDHTSAYDIYRVKRDGTGLQQLTNDGEAVQEYSPDLWTDSLDVSPADRLATTWGAMKMLGVPATEGQINR